MFLIVKSLLVRQGGVDCSGIITVRQIEIRNKSQVSAVNPVASSNNYCVAVRGVHWASVRVRLLAVTQSASSPHQPASTHQLTAAVSFVCARE